MRAVLPIALALACPIGMCLVPMLLMRRKGQTMSCHDDQRSASPDAKEITRLRAEVAALRSEISEQDHLGERELN